MSVGVSNNARPDPPGLNVQSPALPKAANRASGHTQSQNARFSPTANTAGAPGQSAGQATRSVFGAAAEAMPTPSSMMNSGSSTKSSANQEPAKPTIDDVLKNLSNLNAQLGDQDKIRTGISETYDAKRLDAQQSRSMAIDSALANAMGRGVPIDDVIKLGAEVEMGADSQFVKQAEKEISDQLSEIKQERSNLLKSDRKLARQLLSTGGAQTPEAKELKGKLDALDNKATLVETNPKNALILAIAKENDDFVEISMKLDGDQETAKFEAGASDTANQSLRKEIDTATKSLEDLLMGDIEPEQPAKTTQSTNASSSPFASNASQSPFGTTSVGGSPASSASTPSSPFTEADAKLFADLSETQKDLALLFEDTRDNTIAAMTSLQDDLAALEKEYPNAAEYEKQTANDFIKSLAQKLDDLDKGQASLNDSKSTGAAFEFAAQDFATIQKNSRSDENLGERIDLANELTAARKEVTAKLDDLQKLARSLA